MIASDQRILRVSDQRRNKSLDVPVILDHARVAKEVWSARGSDAVSRVLAESDTRSQRGDACQRGESNRSGEFQ
jgi:hypothetical protein